MGNPEKLEDLFINNLSINFRGIEILPFALTPPKMQLNPISFRVPPIHQHYTKQIPENGK